MTRDELAQHLKTLGMPVAYRGFVRPVAPPYLVYVFSANADVMADNQNYAEVDGYQIELYTGDKDPEREAAIQDLLKQLGLPYRKFEAWIESEKLHQIVYEVQVLGG